MRSLFTTKNTQNYSSQWFFRISKLSVVAIITSALIGSSVVTATAAVPMSASTTSGFLHTSGSKILTSAKKPYTIKAISWFGLETSNCTPHGLWQISLDSGLKKIKNAGFNTIRLPFSNECLAASAPNSINYSVNPDLANKKPIQIMDSVITKAKSNGLNVILDRHRPDSGSQSELWYTSQYSESKFISDWVMLAKRYKNNSTVIGVDLHNEPHGNACWGCGDTKRDWKIAATKAGNAVLSANPNLLIIVEGVERQGNGENTWWGGGLADVKKHPIKLSVSNRIVYSPHDYPSSLYNQKWFNASNYPKNLPGQWDKSWGYIHKQNIAPILVGEFGTKLETESDKKWLSSLVSYLKTNNMSFAYWSFNPNSGDTGGIVKDDWTTLQTAKLKALSPILNPATTSPPVNTPVTPPKPITPTKPTATPKPTVPVATGTVKALWTLQSSWQQGYVAEFTVTGKASNWTVSWTDKNAKSIVNAWGMKCSLAAHVITCKGSDWAQKVVAGQTHKTGLQVNATNGPSSKTPKINISAK